MPSGKDEPKRRSDGDKRRSSGEKDRKRHTKTEVGESSKTERKHADATVEKKSRHRDKENRIGEEESHRKHKEREKHRSDRSKDRTDHRSDGDKHKTDRKSDRSKDRTDRRSDGDKHRSERKSDGDKHRTDRRSEGEKQRTERKSDGGRRHSDAEKRKDSEDRGKGKKKSIFDEDVIENRSVVKKEKHQRVRDVSPENKDHKMHRKEEKEKSSEKDSRRSEKERKEHRSSDKKERTKSKESRKRAGDDNDDDDDGGEVRFKLNETYDLEAFKERQKKHKGTKDHRSEEKKKPRSEHKDSEKKRHREEETVSQHSRESNREKSTSDKEKNDGMGQSGSSERQTPDAYEEDEYGYDDDDFEDYDDDDFEEDDDDDEDKQSDNDVEYDDDSANDSDYKLLDKGSSIHEVKDMDNTPPQADVMMFNQKKKSSVKVNVAREVVGSGHSSNTESLNMNEVLKSINDENERVSSGSSRPSTGGERIEKVVDSPKLAKKVFGKINFVAAKQKQLNEKTAKKTKKRGQELLQLIQLDQRHIDLFDMPPMTEYELYMKRFGQSGYTQMYTQTHDDDVTQNTQTDEIDTTSKWCQCSHDIKSCGTDDDKKDSSNLISGPMNINTARLNDFLVKAGQVILSLFNELDAGIEQHKRQYTESRTQFSDGYVTLASADFLVTARAFTNVSYSSSQTNMLLAAYGESQMERQQKNAPKGIIAVWNSNDPTRPSAYLICESCPTSCCFTSSNSSLVFAGMADGVVAVWDLHEPASYHRETMVGESKEVFRSATFTTAALQENHEYPIVAISPILSAGSGGITQNSGGIDMSFQLVSLDQSGVLNIWIVVEAHVDATDLSNVHEDLGLSPCGCIKLSRSATINTLASTFSSFDCLFCATCVQVDLMKPNDVYVGTDRGMIVHALRFGSRPIPKSYKPAKGCGSKVIAIDVSPWKLPYFLACYEDGSISLFHNRKEIALRTWESFSKGEAIIDVKWSRSRPSTFFAIDSQSVFYVWDLCQSDVQPIFSQMMMRKDKRAIGFSLANDYSSLGIGTPGRAAEMVLMYGDGSIEIHRLSKSLSVMDADEIDRVTEYLDNIIPI